MLKVVCSDIFSSIAMDQDFHDSVYCASPPRRKDEHHLHLDIFEQLFQVSKYSYTDTDSQQVAVIRS